MLVPLAQSARETASTRLMRMPALSVALVQLSVRCLLFPKANLSNHKKPDAATKVAASFFLISFLCSFQIYEAGKVRLESELDVSDRAVSLFADDDFGNSLLRRILMIIIIAI